MKPKLWMFRTRNVYYFSIIKPTKADISNAGLATVVPPWALRIGRQPPEGFQALENGSCVPVTLKAEEQHGDCLD